LEEGREERAIRRMADQDVEQNIQNVLKEEKKGTYRLRRAA